MSDAPSQMAKQKSQNRQWPGFWGMTLILTAAFFVCLFLRTRLSVLSLQEGPCTFSRKTHLYCPGCGGTRAVRYFLKGDMLSSFLSNAIPVYTAIVLLRIWVALFHNTVMEKIRKGKKWTLFYRWEMWGILIVVAGYFILRNVFLVLFGWDFLGDMAAYW